MKSLLISCCALLCIFASCSSNDDAEYTAIDEALVLELPDNFPEINYDLSANPPTKNGVELGKKLFYDGKLSANGFISCGFCHEQRFAFTHHGHQFSHGIDDLEGTRNAPAIQNMAFQTEFAWDGATSHLDLFPIIPITNEVEMGDFLESSVEFEHIFTCAKPVAKKKQPPLPFTTSALQQKASNINSVNDCLNYGYTHHIPRLMIIANIMTLSRIHPKEIYKWFMEMFIDSSKTIIWNGPLGLFEIPYYCTGTQSIARSLQERGAEKDIVTIIGGGDTVSAVHSLNPNINFSHISTGGGSSLELLSGKELEALKDII